jgi:hypothetical protein
VIVSDTKAPWRDKAACHDAYEEDPELGAQWISENPFDQLEPRRICVNECRARVECLFSALADKKAEGIRGGFHFSGGAVNKTDAKKIRDEFGVKPRLRHTKAEKEPTE